MQNLPSSIAKRSERGVKRRAKTLAFILVITQVSFLEICKANRATNSKKQQN